MQFILNFFSFSLPQVQLLSSRLRFQQCAINRAPLRRSVWQAGDPRVDARPAEGAREQTDLREH